MRKTKCVSAKIVFSLGVQSEVIHEESYKLQQKNVQVSVIQTKGGQETKVGRKH